jgi:phosphate transport system substrate-binding protein
MPISLLVAIVLSLGGFGPHDVQARQTMIKVAGSSTVLPIVVRAAEAFSARHPHIRVTVNPGGSGVGVKSIGHHLADIGMVSRRIADNEKAGFPKADFQLHVIGRDAVACVVSSEIHDAGVTMLSKEDIRRIYAGEVTNWREVGGPDRDIVAIDKEAHRGTRHVFMEYFFGTSRVKTPGVDLVTGSNNEERTKIALSDAAIGMLSHAWLDNDVVGVGIRDGETVLTLTDEHVRNGIYPMVRELSLVTDGTPSGPASEFIAFLLSPDGQRIVHEMGYVPVR